MFSLMRNVGQGSRQQDLQGEFKTNLRRSCSDIVVNFSYVKGLLLGLTFTDQKKQSFDELSGFSEQKSHKTCWPEIWDRKHQGNLRDYETGICSPVALTVLEKKILLFSKFFLFCSENIRNFGTS
jgi:hypothetical protein